uniref:GMP reductase n=1 Tax=Cyprinus carpio TaxID=7962 RepID=A0A8C2HIJ5_CYPCA
TVSACPSLSFSMRSVTMPRVDADLKLDFKDVLFRPKRSSLSARHSLPSQTHPECLEGMVEELILSGADIIKVGIWPGSVCTTHIKTGVGYPQLSSLNDFVMLGGMSAGHDQCAGEIIEKDSKKFKLFYEMSSDTAMKKYVGGVAEYRASEGRTVQVPYKGDVENTIRDIFGGLRSTCTYVGAAKLKELSRRTTFIRSCTLKIYTHKYKFTS